MIVASRRVPSRTVVHSVSGEPADVELPAAPERRHPPEAIVDAQLAALRDGDAALVRRFASPRNVAATGPLAMFQKMLASPVYAPLGSPDADVEVLRLRYASIFAETTENAPLPTMSK